MDEILEDFRDLQAAIESEYQLNDSRHNFLLVFHAVLFALLGALLSKDAPLELPFGSASDAVAMAGVVSALVSGLAMYAGVVQISALKRHRQEGFPDLAERIQSKTGVDTGSLLHLFGVLPYLFYPPALIAIWAVIWIAL